MTLLSRRLPAGVSASATPKALEVLHTNTVNIESAHEGVLGSNVDQVAEVGNRLHRESDRFSQLHSSKFQYCWELPKSSDRWSPRRWLRCARPLRALPNIKYIVRTLRTRYVPGLDY